MNGLTKPTTIIIVITVVIVVVMLFFSNYEPLLPMTFEEQIKGALK